MGIFGKILLEFKDLIFFFVLIDGLDIFIFVKMLI